VIERHRNRQVAATVRRRARSSKGPNGRWTVDRWWLVCGVFVPGDVLTVVAAVS